MNQGRIWCVVSPQVGLPLLLGSVAVTSLIVHASVMTHTTWMSSYWAGSKGRVAMEGNAPPVATVTPKEGSAFSMTITPVPATGGASPASFVITVTPAAPAPSTVATANADPAGPNPVSHTADAGVVHIPITN